MSSKVIITSISPSLKRGTPPCEEWGWQYQRSCIDSWLSAGAHVISINRAEELRRLSPDFPNVEFRVSRAEPKLRNPRGLPDLMELMAIGAELEKGSVFGITNSDVKFNGSSDILEEIFELSVGGVTYANRHEVASNHAYIGLPYVYGYDLFIADNDFIVPEDLNGFRIGAPWWDYVFIYALAARNVPLKLLSGPAISHSTHIQAWELESWLDGLKVVARRLRQLSEEEGPAAAITGYICRSLEEGSIAGYGISGISQQLGTVLGLAMVDYVRERTASILWAENNSYEGGHALSSPLQETNMVSGFPIIELLSAPATF